MDSYRDDLILYHHGVKGQRWGVRRYQNPDGSLTKKGKRRNALETRKAMGRDINERMTSVNNKLMDAYLADPVAAKENGVASALKDIAATEKRAYKKGGIHKAAVASAFFLVPIIALPVGHILLKHTDSGRTLIQNSVEKQYGGKHIDEYISKLSEYESIVADLSKNKKG